MMAREDKIESAQLVQALSDAMAKSCRDASRQIAEAVDRAVQHHGEAVHHVEWHWGAGEVTVLVVGPKDKRLARFRVKFVIEPAPAP